MAKMVPDEWEDNNDSHAEGLIYRKLRDETPEDWFAVHSVGLGSHSSKPWAEIDFVVIGPFGVLCLEVKGGRVTVTGGRWTTNGIPLNESPFSQAGGAAAALHGELSGRFPALRHAIVGHGVVLPYVTFEAEGPGIDQGLVYDDRDISARIEVYLGRIAKHWLTYHGRLEDRYRPLSRAERAAIFRYVAPSFDLMPTMRARIASTEAELVELTRNQARVLRGLNTEDRAIVRGGAGTGKTMLAIEEAARFAASGQRVLLCCRSRNLADYMSSLMEEDLVDVRDYEDLLRSIVTEADRWAAIPDAADEDVLTVFLPEQAGEALIDLDRVGEYGALVVDEAQDLLIDGALDVFDLLLDGGLEGGRWRFFLDHKQNVFSAVDREQLDRVAKNTTSQYQLYDNCRNTPEISETTCMLSAVDPDETLAGSGPEVETRFVLDRKEDASAAAAIVRGWLRRHVEPETIVVVATDQTVAGRIARTWPVDECRLVQYGDSSGGAVRLAIAADFKGLEAAAVVVVGARELHEPDTLRRMYVACSRARVLLGVVLDESAREDFNLRAIEYARRVTDPE